MDLRQIPQKEALPEDIIILSDKNNVNYILFIPNVRFSFEVSKSY